MIDTIQTLFQSHITSLFGVFLYWLPLVVCLAGFSWRTFTEIGEDIQKRQTKEVYYPRVTIGLILSRFVCSFVPVYNIFQAAFGIFPGVFSKTLDFLEKVLDTPIVAPKKRY